MAGTQTIEVDAFLADSVAAENGKLYAQGAGWNEIRSPIVPARHARIGIGMIVRVPYTATNQAHTFQVELHDSDGQKLPLGDNPQGEGKIEAFGGQFNVGRPPTIQPGDEQIIVFALNIDGYVFEKPDHLCFVISVDGTPIAWLPFRVLLLTQPQPIIKAAE